MGDDDGVDDGSHRTTDGRTNTAAEGRTNTAAEGRTNTAAEGRTNTAADGRTNTAADGRTDETADGTDRSAALAPTEAAEAAVDMEGGRDGGGDDDRQDPPAREDLRSPEPGGHWNRVVDALAGALSDVTGLLEDGESVAQPDAGPTLPEALRDHPTREAVLADAMSLAEVAGPLGTPSREAIRTRLFDFGYLADATEVERYWVNEPFAYVSILEDAGGDRQYRVTEPHLDGYERYVRDELERVLRTDLLYHEPAADDEGLPRRAFLGRARSLLREHASALDPCSAHKLLYYLQRDFLDYDRIDPIVRDGAVEDISCDGADVPVFVYHREHRDLPTNVAFETDALRSFVTRTAQRAGKHISVSTPMVDATLPNGSRVQLTYGGDVASRGPNFTVRQFSSVPDTPVDLINWGTFSAEQLAYFWLAIENNRSLVFAGGTGSGKTTSLNAVSFFIPGNSKVVSIEDTREITLPHENWVQSLTRESVTGSGRGEVSMYHQLQAALRQRPEYLLVGEIRTEADVALTFFQAMATGHTAYTTVHSESVTGVVNRLENDPLGVPRGMIRELDIVSIQRQARLGADRVRRTDHVAELRSQGEGDEIGVNDVYEWDPGTDTHERRNRSEVLADIASDRGWDRRRLDREFDRRVELLEGLVENDITWYEDVARTIHRFTVDQDAALRALRSDGRAVPEGTAGEGTGAGTDADAGAES